MNTELKTGKDQTNKCVLFAHDTESWWVAYPPYRGVTDLSK